ncbi:MAG: RNA pseudouridine synthase [Treponema sp.]|nr:RNA pseudouridine synthase [Treponema sp.]MCL2250913.1 RNA pseudouridine synthase [Treponema sp.]
MDKSRILYQSEACVVINKAVGESVNSVCAESVNKNSTMVNVSFELKSLLGVNFAEAVHRIDVPVTGCTLFALKPDALSFLNSAFARETSLHNAGKNVVKRYWAIVEKTNFKLPANGELIHWIETNTRNNKSFAHNEEKKGCKKAVLKYRIIGEGKNYLFFEIELLSGRHHQIRAQFAAVGLHIKGDLKYGAKRSEKNGGIRLHARYLSFPNPLEKSSFISITADPLEADALWEAVMGYV